MFLLRHGVAVMIQSDRSEDPVPIVAGVKRQGPLCSRFFVLQLFVLNGGSMSHDTGISRDDGIGAAVDSTLDEATDVAETIRDKGSELGRRAIRSIDDRRVGVADGLEGAARGLHSKAESIAGGGERASKATHDVADKVEHASRYIRDKDARDMLADVESMVRAHPTRSLLAVLAVGYVAGRVLRRD